jgi:hypothetical protein
LLVHVACATLQCVEVEGMRNVTLAMDEELLKKGREYARRQGMSFNALMRDLLRKRVLQDPDWIAECFRKMDAAGGRSAGKKWKRGDLNPGRRYDRIQVINPFA